MSGPAPADAATPAGALIVTTPDAAAEAGRPPDAAPSAVSTTLCVNCGTPLTSKYCSECGQRHHDQPVHHFWHFVTEATEDLTHADSRLWQTLIALLFRPGFLTREFLEGRRVRYLPPIRLYLVLSVLFFLVAAHVPGPPGVHQGVVTRMGPQIILTPLGPEGVGAAPVSEARAKSICADFRYGGPAEDRLGPRLDAACIKVVMDNGSFRESFMHSAGRAMFILLPMLALVMKVFYRKPPRYYVEHLLFFVHNHSFLFLALSLYAPIAVFAPVAPREALHAGLWAYVAVYFYVSMRRVYGQGRLLTGTKLAGITCAYIVLGTLTIAAVSVYSLLTL